ncbi:unnamed protein product [Brugia timori]|uniref:WAPL domain-containing protein n=1 Tax=Brugia timori TaxID=42155 RepID=A0A0R3R6L5_9BILA|nr:unnamed protein product [Brugia timori]
MLVSSTSRGSSGKRHCSNSSHRSDSSGATCDSVLGNSDDTKNILDNTLLSTKEQNRETVSEKEILLNSSETKPEILTNKNSSGLSENSSETLCMDESVVDPAVAECLCGILLSLKKEPKSLSASKVQNVVPSTISVCT